MEPKPPTSGDIEILEGVYGRIADYSPRSAFFVTSYQKENESFKRISVYVLIDEEERWNAPYPKFTGSGGSSPEVLEHLRHIFYKYQRESESKIAFVDIKGNKLSIFIARSGDVLIAIEDSDCEPGAVMSFEESHPLYSDLLLLCLLIKRENEKNSKRNPLHNQKMQKSLLLVDLFL